MILTKYKNRKLYSHKLSRYIKLEELPTLDRDGLSVYDKTSSQDVTLQVLTSYLFLEASKGPTFNKNNFNKILNEVRGLI